MVTITAGNSVPGVQLRTLAARWTVWKEVLWRPFWKVIGVAYFLLGVTQTIYGFSATFRAKASWLAPLLDWPWHYWALAILLTAVCAALEGSYRVVSQARAEAQSLVASANKVADDLTTKVAEYETRLTIDFVNYRKYSWLGLSDWPGGKRVSVYLDDVRILNHDDVRCAVKRVSIVLEGANAAEIVKDDWHSFTGAIDIEGRSWIQVAVQYVAILHTATFLLVPGAVKVRVETVGLGTIERDVPPVFILDPVPSGKDPQRQLDRETDQSG